MIALAAGLGYLAGSIPTAGLLSRICDVDLPRDGSGNPGTSNALGTAGWSLASAVLALEAIKGYLAVISGQWIADEWPTGGVRPTGQLVALALGISAIIFQEHWEDAPFTAPVRR